MLADRFNIPVIVMINGIIWQVISLIYIYLKIFYTLQINIS